jgi:predicted MFS family arabinose efflux permease
MVAGSTLKGGPHTLGILMGTAGMGALAGAFYLTSRTSVLGLGGVIGRMTLTLGISLMALHFATNVYIAMPLLFATGLSWMVQLSSTNTVIQTVVDHEKLGRVMSLYAVAFFGGMPLGALLQGALADQIGPMNAFLAAGITVTLAALLYLRALPGIREASRPLYIRLGLLPTSP